MVALAQWHCICSLYNYVSKFLYNLLITASDVYLYSLASFCIISIVLSRSFVELLRKDISCSQFTLAENSFLLKFWNMLLHDRNNIITRLTLFLQRKYLIIFLLYHLLAFSASSYSSFSRWLDRFHPQTSPFSTRHIIWLNYEVSSQLSQPMSILFSYLNSVLQNLKKVIF